MSKHNGDENDQIGDNNSVLSLKIDSEEDDSDTNSSQSTIKAMPSVISTAKDDKDVQAVEENGDSPRAVLPPPQPELPDSVVVVKKAFRQRLSNIYKKLAWFYNKSQHVYQCPAHLSGQFQLRIMAVDMSNAIEIFRSRYPNAIQDITLGSKEEIRDKISAFLKYIVSLKRVQYRNMTRATKFRKIKSLERNLDKLRELLLESKSTNLKNLLMIAEMEIKLTEYDESETFKRAVAKMILKLLKKNEGKLHENFQIIKWRLYKYTAKFNILHGSDTMYFF